MHSKILRNEAFKQKVGLAQLMCNIFLVNIRQIWLNGHFQPFGLTLMPMDIFLAFWIRPNVPAQLNHTLSAIG